MCVLVAHEQVKKSNGERKKRKHFDDSDGVKMLSNEIMVSFSSLNLYAAAACGILLF